MKRFRTLLIVIAVIAAVLVGAEFGVRALVQSQAQQAIEKVDLELKEPTVNLGGGSVLAQLVQGRFVDVSGTAASAVVPFEDHSVPVRGLTYHAGDIRLRSASAAVIGNLALTGTLGYDGLSDLAGLPIGYAGEGRLLVTYSVDILGLNAMKIGISGVPQLDVDKQQVQLQQSRIEVAGVDLAESVSQQIIGRVVKPISLAADERVRITSITVAPDGLLADLTATELPVGR